MTLANFNVGGSSANVNAAIIHFTDKTNQTTAYTEPEGSKQLFVDNNRTDTFTPDGSFDRPFSTIMAAVNQIAANGDNSAYVYNVSIMPGVYLETINLSDSRLVSLIFTGSGTVGTSGVIVGNGVITTPAIEAVNNDNLFSVIFTDIVFIPGSSTHGIEFSSTTPDTSLGKFGIVFRNCGIRGVVDVYFNNVGFVQFDDTGITPNIDATNVNFIQFVVGNGPNPQTPLNISTNTGTATPVNWPGFSRANFMGCGVGSVTCDALSQVLISGCQVSGTLTTSSENTFIVTNSFLSGSIVINTGGVFGLVNSLVAQFDIGPAPSVTVDGELISVLSYITSIPITVNSGGAFVEAVAMHDAGELTVESGGEYSAQGLMGVGTLGVAGHLNPVGNNPDLSGQLTISNATSASFTFENPFTDAPVVIVTPTDDPTAIGGYWVTTVNTGFTINIKNSGTMAFSYIVMGNPN